MDFSPLVVMVLWLRQDQMHLWIPDRSPRTLRAHFDWGSDSWTSTRYRHVLKLVRADLIPKILSLPQKLSQSPRLPCLKRTCWAWSLFFPAFFPEWGLFPDSGLEVFLLGSLGCLYILSIGLYFSRESFSVNWNPLLEPLLTECSANSAIFLVDMILRRIIWNCIGLLAKLTFSPNWFL